ncbi:MAG: ATP-dependent helicase [Desulfovibrionales bacterium]
MGIDYQKQLNPAQLEAVRTTEGPALVIAGAGSGKTRTIVYRLARLVENGVDPESILLLTFTRRAAQEMLIRAGELLDLSLHAASGGTFHGFAFSLLKRHAHALGFKNGFTVMDRTDSQNLTRQVRDNLSLGKGDRTFPKKSTVLELISKSRNKETDLENLLQKESTHLLSHAEDLVKISEGYGSLKLQLGLMDYDDLLFYLERLLLEQPDLAEYVQQVYRYVMVDEYQDTNLVQGRLVKSLGGIHGNVLVVGDDAQSIYAFRGARIQNILNFPHQFPGAKIIKLEENYRSSQEILELTNHILAGSSEKYVKHLFTSRSQGSRPQLIRTLSDQSQAKLVAEKILELSRTYPLHEIAVLFRAGYQSFPLEVVLNRLSMPYQKFGGMRFTEAAHIKDVLAFLRLVLNPADLPAWQRALQHVKGIGPKTCVRILEATLDGNHAYIRKLCSKNSELEAVLSLIDGLRTATDSPKEILEILLQFYMPRMEQIYPDDYPKRIPGLEQLSQIVTGYTHLADFLADLSLESPEQSGSRNLQEDELVLSTIHSAKGLEWSAVLIIDLVEDRFPSRHAAQNLEEFEEERRLMYVACTRAKDFLGLFVPDTVYNRYQSRSEPAVPSPFIAEIPKAAYEEWRESYTGGLVRREPGQQEAPGKPAPASGPHVPFGFCRHKIFGRGKIVGFLPPDKYRVNFPGFGIKIILSDYLELET